MLINLKIAKESFPILLILCLVGLGCFIIGLYPFLWIIAILLIFTCYFFRDPNRKLPTNPKAIYAPADGTILEINPLTIDQQPYTQIVIFMSVFNVHINRVPFSGTIRSVTYCPGRFIAASKKGIETENERMEIQMDTPYGAIQFTQLAGLIARKIVCRLNPGQSVNSGEKFGLIKFGSRMDVYFPNKATVKVQIGDTVKGGITILADF